MYNETFPIIMSKEVYASRKICPNTDGNDRYGIAEHGSFLCLRLSIR